MNVETTLKQIDLIIQMIKLKDDTKSFFSKKSLYKFEFRLFVCMDIVRFELQKEHKISDDTASALDPLFGFHCREFYRLDFPEVFEACMDLYFDHLRQYNEKVITDSLRKHLGSDLNKWSRYFKRRLSTLILELFLCVREARFFSSSSLSRGDVVEKKC